MQYEILVSTLVKVTGLFNKGNVQKWAKTPSNGRLSQSLKECYLLIYEIDVSALFIAL